MTSQGMFNWLLFNALIVYLPIAAVILWRRPATWLLLLTIFLGIVIGWLDMKTTEASVSALMLLTLGFFCGFAQPKRAWLSALALGAGVPLFAWLATFLHLNTLTLVEQVTSLLALVFAFGGAYAGALVRRVSKGRFSQGPETA